MNRRPGLGSRPEGCGVPRRSGGTGSTRYSDITFDDRNPVKRYLQRRRLRDALRVLEDLDGSFAGGILDFGGGSGELAAAIARRFPDAGVFCYEPSPRIFDEARENLAGLENVVPGPRLSLEGGC